MRFVLRAGDADEVLILRVDTGEAVATFYPEALGVITEDMVHYVVAAMNKHEQVHGRGGGDVRPQSG